MRGGLRAVRRLAAWVTGVLFAALFLGPAALSEPLAHWLPRLQAGPTLLRLLATGGLAAGAVLAVVVAVSLLGGRLYCAAWCPLGVLQDALRWLLRRVGQLRRWQDRPRSEPLRPDPRRTVRWLVFLAVAIGAALGSLALVALLEPYSAFGRLAEHVCRPALDGLRGVLSAGLEHLGVYALSAAAPPSAPGLVVLVTAVFLAGLVLLVALGGRLYCVALCPVGTCLGLLSQAAPVRVRADAAACTGCGVCARRCRASCIRIVGGVATVVVAACVACMDCLVTCPTGGMRYGPPAPAPAPPVRQPGGAARRELLAAGSTAVVLAAARPLGALLPGALPRNGSPGPVCPPGSGERDRFVERCTACQLCVQACPTHVLRPALLEYGPAGILQPRLSFRHGFCEYDCQRCTTVCPNGALLPLDLEQKQVTQLGVARLYKGRCVVYCRGEACGACVEVCPTHAVYSQEIGGLLCPEMAPGSCIGCGACEFACPAGPKAIEVHASAVHGRAAPPHAAAAPSASTPPASSTDGFPF